MIEYIGKVEDGLPVLDVQAHAWLPGPRTAGIVYTHRLTVSLLDDNGALKDTDAVLTRARQLGWVQTRTTPAGPLHAPAGKPDWRESTWS
ncbi:hypothetical protein ACFRAI_43090 [Streptomyces sp. NPDC056637]|uniref:hypothetical protein n=1 Tax=unclassified Streptomyces TaxID=2593676 RepID=UPI003628F4A5